MTGDREYLGQSFERGRIQRNFHLGWQISYRMGGEIRPDLL
jgi:hypothetical protein